MKELNKIPIIKDNATKQELDQMFKELMQQETDMPTKTELNKIFQERAVG